MAEQKTNFLDADDLRPIIKFASKNWHIVLLFAILALIIAYLYSHRLQNIYAAKTEILLKSSDTYDYQNQIYSELGYYSLLQDVTNQRRILSSHDLIKSVLEKVDFSISYFIVGRLKTSQVEKFSAFDIVCDWQKLDGSLYNQDIKIKVIDLKNYTLSYKLNNQEISHTLEFGKLFEDGNISIQLNLSPLVDESWLPSVKEQNFQFQVHSQNYLIGKYKRNLEIENVEYTSILTLTCKDELATRAKIFLDTLAQVYIDFTLENQIAINENTQTYIDRQLDEIVLIMDSLEKAMDDFKDARDILDLDQEQVAAFDALTQADLDRRKLQLRYEAVGSLEKFLLTEKDNNSIPPMNYLEGEDGTLRNLIQELFNLGQQRSSLLVDVTEVDSRVNRIDSTIKAIRTSIFRYTRDTKIAINSRIKDVERQISSLEAKLSSIPKSERDLLSIERRLNVNEGLYTFLLEKKANTVIAKAAIIPQTSVIERARSIGVVGPDKKGIIYLALGIGVLISFIVGLIRAVFFERIENTRELKSITKISLLGSIPHYQDSDEQPLVLQNSPRSNVSEAFRSMRTNLQYILPDPGGKIILITSLHPGEGKTFVSANMATVLAKASKKVIILDFDMHKPKIHKTFGLQNVSGISSFLIGRTNILDSVMPTQVENLDVVTAGPVPPNASELILNKKVDELLETFRSIYDYVIVDTPPLMLISDSLVLLQKVHYGIFILNTEKATKQGVRFLEDVLNQNNLRNNCLVLNNVKEKRWKYYYGKYAYRYGYGYGYGYGYSYGNGYRYGGYGYGYGEDPKEKQSKRSKKSD
ncbi:MAG: hypothetical protein RLZZ77_1593 [Bacteroidota bacterium]|jgi:capsular exopolysaccharide synthesis family protein